MDQQEFADRTEAIKTRLYSGMTFKTSLPIRWMRKGRKILRSLSLRSTSAVI